MQSLHGELVVLTFGCNEAPYERVVSLFRLTFIKGVILPLETPKYCVLFYHNEKEHNEVHDHDLLTILESCLTLVGCRDQNIVRQHQEPNSDARWPQEQ